MNLIDFGHSLLTGEWKLQRAAVREQRAFLEATHDRRMQLYAGARPTINRPSPNTLSTPEDYRQASERIVLIRAARQMEEDYGFFDGLLDDFETYVVGETLVYLPNTGSAEADRLIREYLEWQFDQVDYSQRIDLTKIAQLAIRSMKRDGECGFIPVDVGDSIKLRYYSGDCIGNPMTGTYAGPNDYNGIVADPATDAPVRYNLFKRNPRMAMYTADRTVPADQFWHYYDPFRLQQFHGVTAFKNAIRDAFDIDQILEFTKMNIKWRSSQLPTIHTESGKPPRGSGYFHFPDVTTPSEPTVNGLSENGSPKPLQVDVDGVTTTYMGVGESVVDFPHDFPNAQLQVSVEEFRRQCCKGAKIPYEFAYRADNGGVVQRFWCNKAENSFLRDKHLMKRTLLNRYKNRAIQKGIDTGELNLDSFGTLNSDVLRFRGTWQMGRQISVDYGRENDTDIKLIEAGLMSPQDKAASDGRNLDEISDEIEAHTVRLFGMAKRIAAKVGQPVEAVMPFLVKKYPNPAATPAPAGAGPDPAEVAAGGN